MYNGEGGWQILFQLISELRFDEEKKKSSKTLKTNKFCGLFVVTAHFFRDLSCLFKKKYYLIFIALCLKIFCPKAHD